MAKVLITLILEIKNLPFRQNVARMYELSTHEPFFLFFFSIIKCIRSFVDVIRFLEKALDYLLCETRNITCAGAE